MFEAKDPKTTLTKTEIKEKLQRTPGDSKQQRFDCAVVFVQDVIPVVEQPELKARGKSSNVPTRDVSGVAKA